MANRVRMAVEEAITGYAKAGWSQRRIARALGINRETVARYMKLASNPAIVPAGRDEANPAIVPTGAEGSTPAIVPAGNLLDATPGKSGRVSQCAPFRETIERGLEQGLTAQRIYQDLVTERAFPGRYDAVKRFVRRLRKVAPERFFRLECLPGEEAQVDFGRGAPVRMPEGRHRKTWVFRVVLSFSRKAYSEVVFRQTTEAFIRALENAFRYFGGAPETVVIDNLRAAVKVPDWYEPELNPKVREFARFYGTVIVPTRPYTPEHKGKVENSVGYVKSNALKARVFESQDAENAFLRAWEEGVADQRIHGTTRQQVLARFQQERPHLRPLPVGVFPSFQEGRRHVHRDGFVEVEKGYYEAPLEYLQRDVWVRWDGRTVRILNDRFEQVQIHARVVPGIFSYTDQTTSQQRQSHIMRSSSWLIQKAIRIGPQCGAWADAALGNRGVEAIRPLYGFLNLAKHYAATRLDQACATALAEGRFQLRDIKVILEAPQAQQEVMPFLETHPLIRDIAEYGQFLEDLYPEDEIINTQEEKPV